MRPRQLRRLIDRKARKAAKRGGFLIPLYFKCPTCKGDGKRWRLLFWRIGRCIFCKGSGLDTVKAIERIRLAVIKNEVKKLEAANNGDIKPGEVKA